MKYIFKCRRTFNAALTQAFTDNGTVLDAPDVGVGNNKSYSLNNNRDKYGVTIGEGSRVGLIKSEILVDKTQSFTYPQVGAPFFGFRHSLDSTIFSEMTLNNSIRVGFGEGSYSSIDIKGTSMDVPLRVPGVIYDPQAPGYDEALATKHNLNKILLGGEKTKGSVNSEERDQL